MAERLRLKRIERKPKKVYFVSGIDTSGLSRSAIGDLNALRIAIERGSEVAERYYRTEIDQSIDQMLGRYGIMHLHLGGRSSNDLVFAVQYEDAVVVLDISDHRHFADRPPGSRLASRNPEPRVAIPKQPRNFKTGGKIKLKPRTRD